MNKKFKTNHDIEINQIDNHKSIYDFEVNAGDLIVLDDQILTKILYLTNLPATIRIFSQLSLYWYLKFNEENFCKSVLLNYTRGDFKYERSFIYSLFLFL